MAKFILSMDGLVLKEYTVTKERTTIGRKPHNDIQIDNLAVSGDHAVIVTILNDSFLEDLGSTNGTLVNGQPIKKHFLQNNDVVELGKYKLKYMSDTAAAVPRAQDFERTMVLRPKSTLSAAMQQMRTSGSIVPIGSGAAAEAAGPVTANQAIGTPAMAEGGIGLSASQPMASIGESQPGRSAFGSTVSSGAQHHAAGASGIGAGGQGLGAIQVLTGSNAGRELELTKALTTLGKPGVQVAVITKRPQGYYITHVEGSVFPIVNGRALDVQAHPLGDHDVIELAGVKMEFYLK
ncbi:MAG: FHA domain-containing protein [Burkholderiales bacterium]